MIEIKKNFISKNKYNFLFFFLITIVFVERFFRITKIGIDGCDNFFYWETARKWSENSIDLTKHYRPLIYFIHSLGFHVFGQNDYTLKLVNSCFDVGTITLLFFITKKITKEKFVALLVVVAYGLLPQAIIFARSEMPHTVSVFFVLSTVFLLFLYVDSHKKTPLVFAGIAAAVAMNTHPELIVLNIGVGVVLILINREKTRIQTIKKSTLPILFFLTGFIFIFILLGYFFGFNKLFNLFIHNGKSEFAFTPRFFINLIKAPLFLIYWNASLFVLIAFWGSLFFFKKTQKKIGYLIIIVFSYLITYPFFSPAIILGRLFFPVFSLVILILFALFYNLLLYHNVSYFKYLLIAFLFLFVYTARLEYKPYEYFSTNIVFDNSFKILMSENQKQSPYRKIYDKFKTQINANNKLLVTPFVFYEAFGRRPLASNAYFGKENVKYVAFLNTSFDKFIKKKQVKYILIAKKYHDQRLLKRWHFQNLSKNYMIKPQNYTIEKDHQVILNVIKKYNGKLIYKSEFANIYEIKK